MIPPLLPSPVRKALVAAAAAVALTGCGFTSDEPKEATGTGPGTDLKIVVVADEGAAENVMTLTCDPTGGDHPNAEAACNKLQQAEANVFEPVAGGQPCTMIYGGPQTATVKGVLDGEQIDASFSRQNGCEIDRWDALGTEVFDVPLQ